MPADVSERGLESRVCAILTGYSDCGPGAAASDAGAAPSGGGVAERPAVYGAGWVCGSSDDYDREHCVDLAQLGAFLCATQPTVADALQIDADTPTRRGFLTRLKGEIDSRGAVDVLRKGVKHRQHSVDLYYASATPGNDAAAALHRENRFSVTRQLRYSNANRRRALDIGMFINGLPVITAELKNNLTRQTAADAAEQYRNDRGGQGEPLFRVGRCLAHFAVDERDALFCAELAGKSPEFLPFNKGWDGGAGNPPNPNGLQTDYLWRETLSRDSLADIVENYALLTPDGRQIWPRYHQLDAVQRLLDDAADMGAGRRYLVQHSAGSGKSNTIAWLSQRLISLRRGGKPVFDSIIVVTDRVILDSQINATIQQFTQVRAAVDHANKSGDLRRFIRDGKKVIIATAQKFPFILDEIEGERQERCYAIIIDEAHSGQGGRRGSAIAEALGGGQGASDSAGGGGGDDNSDDDDLFEDQINRIIASRRMLPNASYFAFTATPKNRTLELFGAPDPQPDGRVRHLPFHAYTMKQAIQEGFILDVLASYTQISSYYNLVKTIAADPKFDKRRAQQKLRRFVEGHEYSIRQKAAIMVDHFLDEVIAPRKVNGQARAMVVAEGVDRAIDYFDAVSDCLRERDSPYKAIVAFSGERERGGKSVTEADVNGFPSERIADMIKEDPYRILICADKFQTGYDEPLLQTMYVDKPLSGVRAVQTLSRLNRTGAGKRDVFALDFANSAEGIKAAFADYYRATILADETDPNKLHDLKARLDGRVIYGAADVDAFATAYLGGADRGALDPILDRCVAAYRAELDEDAQVDFKGNAKAFCRLYDFLSQILAYGLPEWEKLSIFLTFLIPKLPAPVEDDLSRGMLELVDMESYRAEKQATASIPLEDEDGEIPPVPPSGGGARPDPETAALSEIISDFNSRWGSEFTDADRVVDIIVRLPKQVAEDAAFQNARRNSDIENARLEHNKALGRTLVGTLRADEELYKRYAENSDFQVWLQSRIFGAAYGGAAD